MQLLTDPKFCDVSLSSAPAVVLNQHLLAWQFDQLSAEFQLRFASHCAPGKGLTQLPAGVCSQEGSFWSE
jgi:hypothetical protein